MAVLMMQPVIFFIIKKTTIITISANAKYIKLSIAMKFLFDFRQQNYEIRWDIVKK